MSMKYALHLIAFFVVATLTLPSCVSKKKFDQLQEEKNTLASTLAESQSKVKMLEDKVASLEADLAAQTNKLSSDLDQLRKELEAAKADLASTKKSLEAKQAEIAQIKQDVKDAFGVSGDVAVEEQNGDMVVKLDEQVNYASGSSKLNRKSRNAISALATTLKNNPNMRVLIEGHADSQKYPAGSGMDNWQLSVNRAMVVVKRLIRNGVNPEQLVVAGRGDTAPVGPNDSRDGRAKNRRTVAKPEPATGKIYNIGGN
jgi:chemotaxis protein MotB